MSAQRIRELVETSEAVDPQQIAAEVAAALTRAQKIDAFDALLAPYVQDLVRRLRNVSPAVPDGQQTNGSPKWDRVRSWFESYRVNVDGEWRFLKGLTADDCDLVAEQRRQEAAELLAVAVKFEKLAARARELGAATIAALPLGDVAEILA